MNAKTMLTLANHRLMNLHWHIIRKCSTKKNKVLKRYYDTKQLVGAVIKKEQRTEIEDDVHDEFSALRSKYTNVTDETSSEYHWMIEKQSHSRHVQIFKCRKPIDSVNEPFASTASTPTSTPTSTATPKKSNSIEHISPISATSVISSAKDLLKEFVISKRSRSVTNDSITLPFDENGLKSIVNYPIMCNKAKKSILDDHLYDKSLPSISKVLQATMSESARIALQRWKAAKIAELGEAGFRQYEQDTLEIGKQFHMAIEKYLRYRMEPAIDSPISKLWHSLSGHLKELNPEPVLVEKQIIHTDLKYKGIIDNVSYVNKELCALEWKTSEKMKSTLISTYDAPVQLCAYIGALNIDPRYDIKVHTGYVVVAYKTGEMAHIYRLSETDIRKYWSIWLQRLQEYWIRYRDGTLPDPI